MEKDTSVHGQNVPVAVEHVTGSPTVGIVPHTLLISGMLTDYVIEFFLC